MQSDPHTIDAEKTRGGSGGPSGPDTMDVRLTALALRELWPMSPEARVAAIKRLEAVVSNPETSRRAFHAAVKALAGLSRLNLQAIDTMLHAREQEELEERLVELEQKTACAR
jgi:hypothetical protein